MEHFESGLPPQSKESPSGLMSFEEYAEAHHESPYKFELESRDKYIAYFGARHSHDPTDPQFDRIENLMRTAKPQIVFVEGMEVINQHPQRVMALLAKMERKKVIHEMGEPGFTAWLAAKTAIEVKSPEPRLNDEVRHLLELKFSREHIAAYYFYRQVAQYHGRAEYSDLEEYLQRYINAFKSKTHWDGFDYSASHFFAVGKDIWGVAPNAKNSRSYENKVDPVPWPSSRKNQTIINDIAREVNRYRDEYLLNEISHFLWEKNRIFIVFGASHAYMQEGALKNIVTKPFRSRP